MQSITIWLPRLPKELSPNSRCHWSARYKATRAVLRMVEAKTREAMGTHAPPRWKLARASATFYFRSNRRRDRDNLAASLKYVYDGFEDAGVVADDRDIIPMPPAIVIDRVRREGVEITVAPE